MYDVFFISYDELNADINWQRLLKFAPLARRIHGIKGILNAHKEAARQSNTDAFFVIDGDAWVYDNCDFSSETLDTIQIYGTRSPADCVLVWRSRNPYNGLEYGYGGIKLLPKEATLNAMSNIDITLNISDCFLLVDHVACETRFATSSFNTWRSAFRECAKLSSATAVGKNGNEWANQVNKSNEWLDIWTSTATGQYAKEIIHGAGKGQEYGIENKNNKTMLLNINDYDWMKEQYEQTFQ